MNEPNPFSVCLEAVDQHRCWIDLRTDGLSHLESQLRVPLRGRTVVLITDRQVQSLYGQLVVDQLKKLSSKVLVHALEPGETTKSPATLLSLWDRLASDRVDRQTVMIALGGGVVGDAAGFVAATYGRGLSLIQLPTTLMAQVDSSIGGKVGINLDAGKNLVGCIWQPEQVLIDPTVLRSLVASEFRSGLAEVVKYGVILGAEFFHWLGEKAEAILDREPGIVGRVVAACCQSKVDLVQQDPRDLTGLRAKLNYGHTFGHAIENVFGYGTFTHGQAIAIGMSLAARLAENLGWVNGEFVAMQDDLLRRFQLPTRLPANRSEELMAAMRLDKKNADGKIRFALPRGLGDLKLTDSPAEHDLFEVLNSVSPAGEP